MKTLARLVTRMQGEGDGLFIGVTLKNHNFFKPNTVYEIVERFGEIAIREVGQGVPAESGETVADSPVREHWANYIGDIIGTLGQTLFLTRDELKSIRENHNERDL